MSRDEKIRNWRSCAAWASLRTLLPCLVLTGALPAQSTLASKVAAAALQPPQRGGPVFRAGTRLVELTVTVRDNKGQAVSGLTISDFTVEDRGRKRPLAFFRFDGEARPQVAEAAEAPGVFTNSLGATGGKSRNITALVLDSLNTPAQGGMMARAQAMRYLKALAPETFMAIFHMGRELEILHDFTDDAASLRARLEKVTLGAPLEGISDFERSVAEAEQFIRMFKDRVFSGGGTRAVRAAAEVIQQKQRELEAEMRANAAARRSRMERGLATIEALGSHLAGIPGRKNLVWITWGFTMVSVMGAYGVGARGGFDSYEAQVERTSQHLAQLGIVLYIVDSRGLTGLPDANTGFASTPSRPVYLGMPGRGGNFERQLDAERTNNDPKSTMQLMASVTGGRYLYNTNDLASGFRQVAADLRGSYTLGFYAPDEADGRWHRLKVRVKRSGVTVRHRQGYLSETAPPGPVEWNDEMWKQALSNPVGSSLIPLRATRARTPAGELVLRIFIDPGGLEFRPEGDRLKAVLRIAVAEETAGGHAPPHISELKISIPAAEWESERARGIPFRRQWVPSPGAAGLRVLAVDMQTGRYGSLDVPLGEPQ